MLREVKVPNLQINVPQGSAFAYETPKNMPQAHFLAACIAPRGGGKTVIVVNLLERMPIDRLIVISPSMLSNKPLMDRLKPMLDPKDIFDDPNDISCIDKVIAICEQERDDYDEYHAKMKRLQQTKKKTHGLFALEHQSFVKEDIPKHRWNGRRPFLALFCDDVFGANLMIGKGAQKIANLCIKHRHLGQLKTGGSIGISCIFAMQAYKSNLGGLPKALRGNLTMLIIGKLKSALDLDSVAEECSGEISRAEFQLVYDRATDTPHSFLLIDLFKKDFHPSRFRVGLDTFLVV